MKKQLMVWAALAAAVIPTLAFAAVSSGGFERKAKIRADGERVKVEVPLTCDVAQEAVLKVVVTQGSVNEEERALGRAREKVECPTEPSGLKVRVEAKKGVFAAGKATACGLALTDDDARQWCKDIKLVD